MNKSFAASSPVRCVLDTDAFNEVDDQFALAHLLLSPDRVDLRAVYAAPFTNERAASPGIGMEKSYEEIFRVLELVPGRPPPPVFRGSREYLGKMGKAVSSDAVDHLIETARAKDGLLVLGIGACTNIASALSLAPDIASNIRLVWLGGHGYDWPHNNEFNLRQDPLSARILFRSRAEMVWLPCQPVCSHLATTTAELERWLAPFSKLGGYLTQIVGSYRNCNHPGQSKIIWDLGVSAYALDPDWVVTRELPGRDIDSEGRWGSVIEDRTLLAAIGIKRDAVFSDFFSRARLMGEGTQNR